MRRPISARAATSRWPAGCAPRLAMSRACTSSLVSPSFGCRRHLRPPYQQHGGAGQQLLLDRPLVVAGQGGQPTADGGRREATAGLERPAVELDVAATRSKRWHADLAAEAGEVDQVLAVGPPVASVNWDRNLLASAAEVCHSSASVGPAAVALRRSARAAARHKGDFRDVRSRTGSAAGAQGSGSAVTSTSVTSRP